MCSTNQISRVAATMREAEGSFETKKKWEGGKPPEAQI